MIDTIGIEFASVNIPKRAYSSWDDMQKHRNRNYVISWYGFTRYLPNESAIRYTYYPNIKSGLLKIEFSLPKIVFGNNIQMIENVEEAIDTANSMMPDVPDVPKIDLWAGILYRLDVCFNFQVIDLVPWYIKSLLALEYPYRRTRPYTSQGVQYENTLVILRIYDKARERMDMGDQPGASTASGILRVEIELKRAYIKRLTQCKNPTLRSISEKWAYDVIENELQKLDLLGNSIGTFDSTLRILRGQYGAWEALALLGLLHAKIAYPSKELLAKDVSLHPNSIGRHLQKKFVGNNIPLTLTDHSKPLPPLHIDRPVSAELG